MTYQQRFETDGFCFVENVVSVAALDGLESTLRRQLRKAISRLSRANRTIFEEREVSDSGLFHRGVLSLHTLEPRQLQCVIDAATNSASLYRLITDAAVIDLAIELTGVQAPLDLGLTGAYLRMDYPQIFSQHVERIHLPWHQESGYFRDNLSQATGVVACIPVFDCSKRHGALRVLAGSHKQGPVPHEEYFKDPVRRAHRRARVPDGLLCEFEEVVLDMPRGGVGFQHFHTIHRSGDNEFEDRVRYTVIARFSNMLADDYRPVSWNRTPSS